MKTILLLLALSGYPGQAVEVTARKDDDTEVHFTTKCRIDTPVEVEYYRHGGILNFVLRQLAASR